MKKIFLIIWAIMFIFAVFIIVGSTNKTLGRKLIHHYPDGFTGNLYEASMLDDFKERLNSFSFQLHNKLEESRIITFGDSFLDVDFNSPCFDVELQKKTGIPVFKKMDYVAFDRPVVDFNPLNFLKSVHYIKGEKKYMIVESVERFSIRNAEAYKESTEKVEKIGLLERIFEGLSWRMAAFDKWMRQNIVLLNNYNYPLQYFFHENILCYPINHWIANVRFHLLGEIDPEVGAYSLKHKMLFDGDGVKFTKRIKTKEEIGKMVDNIEYLSNRLKDDYNIELIYVITPNKYSIYNDYVTGHHTYDNFIPDVVHQLTQKGIKSIDLYSAYMDERARDDSRPLYLNSDEHFGPLGKSIMVDLTINQLSFVNLRHK